jgi:hypothetical protein
MSLPAHAGGDELFCAYIFYMQRGAAAARDYGSGPTLPPDLIGF